MRQLDPFPEQCEQRTNQGVISDTLVFYLSKRERYLYTVVLLIPQTLANSETFRLPLLYAASRFLKNCVSLPPPTEICTENLLEIL